MADVYGWLALATVDEAMAQARADMGKRGYLIERVHVTRDTTRDDPEKQDWTVRMNKWVASRFGRHYAFYPPARQPGGRDRPHQGSRRAWPLLGFGATWAILDDVERSQFIKTAPASDKHALVRIRPGPG